MSFDEKSSSANARAPAVRVGSWPGPSFDDNAFISIFCRSLEEAGAEVIDVRDPSRVSESIDILQIHWAEKIFWRRTGRFKRVLLVMRTLAAIVRLKRRGVRVFWMVHNLRPHDAGSFDRALWRFYAGCLARLVDGYVSLSPATLPIIASAFPFRSSAVAVAVRHPRYQTDASREDRAAIRGRLGLPDARLLFAFVGNIRPYKGVASLMQAIIDGLPGSVALVAAGRTSDAALQAELTALAERSPHILFLPERLDETAFESIVRASDYVILPFVDTLHSGSVIHALSLNRPVVTPATPYAQELANTVGMEWVKTYQGVLTSALLTSMPLPPQDLPDLSMLDPRILGQELIKSYRQTMN